MPRDSSPSAPRACAPPDTAARFDDSISGLSLVEVLIATALLAITVLISLQGHLTAFDSAKASRQATIAVDDLQSAAESLLAVKATEIPIAGSEFEAGVPIPRFTDAHLPNERIVATYPGYTPGGAVPNPLIIVLTVEWTDPSGRARSMVLRTAKVQ